MLLQGTSGEEVLSNAQVLVIRGFSIVWLSCIQIVHTLIHR